VVKALCVQILGFERFISNAKSRGMEFAVSLDHYTSLTSKKAKPPEGGFNRHASEVALPRLRGWVNPERDPDSCQRSPVTGAIMATGISEFKRA
jgi:hypothetical protein